MPYGSGMDAIVFRRASGSHEDMPEPHSTMLYADFVNHHRPWARKDEGPAGLPEVFPVPGEEWEHVNDHTAIEITVIDAAREVVHVVERKAKRRRSIPLREFSSPSWRKIVRRTSFEHLMDDEL